MKVVVHVDGGARGNPGPAAIGVVVSSPDGEVLDEVAEPIGVATNNVAEYRALLRGLERARALGASEVEIVNDSELVARQLTGAYKVKHPAMKPLHAEAMAALREVRRLAGPQRPARRERPRRRAGQRGARPRLAWCYPSPGDSRDPADGSGDRMKVRALMVGVTAACASLLVAAGPAFATVSSSARDRHLVREPVPDRRSVSRAPRTAPPATSSTSTATRGPAA